MLPCLSRNNASDQPLCDLAAVGLPQIVRCATMSEHIPALGPSFYSKLEGDPSSVNVAIRPTATLMEPCQMQALAARARASARKTAATDGSRRPIWPRSPTLATRLLVRELRPTVRDRESLRGPPGYKNSRLAVSNGEPSERSRPSVVCGCRKARSAHRPSRPSRYLVSCSPPWRCWPYRPSHRPRTASGSRLPPPAGRPRSSARMAHGRRRPPDRGDRQLHRGGDDA